MSPTGTARSPRTRRISSRSRPKGARAGDSIDSRSDCVFCRIAAHEAPATIRFEDTEIVAFDAEPRATPLHVLVIPRRHIRSVADLTDADLAGRLVLVAARIARDAGVSSFRLATNSGAPLQDVFHLHWHVMAGGEMGHPAGIAFSRRGAP